ncbi:MAG: hypothetical protein NYU90_03350 [Aigarchaeota archaeon]|nr:hypothetical protein [Candidatus Calditenuis fumarioli]
MDAIGHDVLTIHHLALEDDPRYADNEEYISMTRGLLKAVTIFDLLNLVAAVSEAVGERAGREIYLAYLRSEEHVVLFPPPPGSWEEHVEEVFPDLVRGVDYLGVLIERALETNHDVTRYVTWRREYRGRFRTKVVSPSEALGKT